jgi:hypothetical protein
MNTESRHKDVTMSDALAIFFKKYEFAIILSEREADLNPCLLHVINALSSQEGRQDRTIAGKLLLRGFCRNRNFLRIAMTTETSGCILAPWGHITATAWLIGEGVSYAL